MTDHTPFAQPSDPTVIRTPTPLPALGFVLAAGWLLIASVWAFVTSHRAAGFEGQLQFLRAANALGAIVVVVPPLLLRQIPALLRRQAMPFLVLAGALTLVELVVGGSGTAPLLVVDTAVLYVIGWLRSGGAIPSSCSSPLPHQSCTGWACSHPRCSSCSSTPRFSGTERPDGQPRGSSSKPC